MSCLHPSSDFVVHLCSCWIVSCLVLFLQVWYAEGQNVNLEFPVYNDSAFTCTGIPYVVGYSYCFYNNTAGDSVDVLPSAYNNIYPNQAARFMYSSPIVFQNAGATVEASFSTFFIFSVSPLANYTKANQIGGGFAFMVAPEINTPDNSANGGFGMFPIDPKTGKATITAPMVMGVEFDTFLSPGIDIVPVPHIGIDITALGGATGNNATAVGKEFLDTTVGMWIDYNSTLQTLNVFCIPLNATDASAASQKPDTPIVAMGGLVLHENLNRRSYIGFGASVYGGGFEENLLYYWKFQTFGFPPESLLTQWYQWWAPLSTTSKVALIAGAVVGTVGGAYLCSECLFFCFFKRIKNPQTPAEERWPVRRRKSLPGTKTKKLPRMKVRDSLSVANPLHLWGTPLEPAEDPDGEQSPTAGPEDDSSNEDTPLMSPPDIEEDEQVPEVEAIKDFEAMAKRVEQKWASKLGEKSPPESRKPAPVQKAVPLSAKGKVSLNEVIIERTSTPAKTKPAPEVAKQQALIERKPSQGGAKGPGSPTEKKIGAPQSPGQGVQAVKPGSPPRQRTTQAPQKPGEKKVAPQGAKPGSPPQERPPQGPGEKKVAPQGAKPSSPPQQRPPQAPGEKKVAAPQGAKPTSPLREGQSQGPKQATPQQARKTLSPQRTSPPRTITAAAQKSPPQGPRPLQVQKKELPKAPRPSPQTSPPKATPRPSHRASSPKPAPRPSTKSPPKKTA